MIDNLSTSIISQELINSQIELKECLFCGADHFGRWCMAIADDNLYFNYMNELMETYGC